jgi:thymidine kinase
MTKVETEQSRESTVEFLEKSIKNDIDSDILEIYSVLEEKCPEILMPENLEVPEEKIEDFTAKHYAIYSKKADCILSNPLPSSLIFSSGMFGGKTTLSFFLLDGLIYQKKKVEVLIADVMGESFVTARSYKGGRRYDATRFGCMTDYELTMEYLANDDTEVVFLDEFSFLDIQIVEDLQEMCQKTGKKLILTGLNSSYLGMPLPAFHENSKILQNSVEEKCYSFVCGFCEEEPLGTSTIRYVHLNDRWVLDVGLLPLVVSKEKVKIVKYAPGMQDHTAVHILQNHPYLLNKVLVPSRERVFQQENLLARLEEENGY